MTFNERERCLTPFRIIAPFSFECHYWRRVQQHLSNLSLKNHFVLNLFKTLLIWNGYYSNCKRKSATDHFDETLIWESCMVILAVITNFVVTLENEDGIWLLEKLRDQKIQAEILQSLETYLCTETSQMCGIFMVIAIFLQESAVSLYYTNYSPLFPPNR